MGQRNKSGSASVLSGQDVRALVEVFQRDPAKIALQAYDLARHDPNGAAAAIIGLTQQIACLTAQNESLQVKANTDGLTGLHNKSHLMSQLSRIYNPPAQKERRHAQASDYLLMIDLDGFKPINDTFGHAAGDEALKKVGLALRHNTRESDIIARMGGDEFTVLLRSTNEADAQAKAERITQLFKNLTFTWEGQEIPIRGSVGVCPYDPAITPERNIEKADQKMYAIKRNKGDTRNGMLKPGTP